MLVFHFGGEISCNLHTSRHSVPVFRVYGTGRRKSTTVEEGALGSLSNTGTLVSTAGSTDQGLDDFGIGACARFV